MAAITDPQCREELKNFSDLTAQMSTYTGRYPSLKANVAGASKPVYDAVAEKAPGFDPKNLAAACSQNEDPDDPKSPIKKATVDELDALGQKAANHLAQIGLVLLKNQLCGGVVAAA